MLEASEVGLGGVLDGVPLVAEVGAGESEGYRDAEPEHEQREHGAEGDGARGLLSPDEEVEHEEDDEDDAGEHEGLGRVRVRGER